MNKDKLNLCWTIACVLREGFKKFQDANCSLKTDELKQGQLVQIEKSPNDVRNYLGFQLDNGIKVVVISDETAEKSAASLDVSVGQIHDPAEHQGLAHFCEHMLFMGTEKYPAQNDYSQYLNQNGGSDNAYTDMMNTNYYFDVKSDAFEGALDRFSQFFITPLFDASCVDKEINAIENEHQMNVSEDSSRQWGVFKALAKEGSKFSQYGGGCLATLQKDKVREALLKFYEENYCAQKMNLVMYGKETIAELQSLAVKYFSTVSNSDKAYTKEQSGQSQDEHPFPREQLSKFVKIIPIKDEDTIEFCWVVEDQRKFQDVRPDDYLQHIFGHEGKNSLLSLLIDEGLAVEITSYSENCIKLFTIIGFNITLTQRGFQNYKRVCHVVSNYIQILRGNVANLEAYEEIKDIEAINFRFLEKIATGEYVTKIADELHQYPMSQVLKAVFDFKHFDKQIIQTLIDSLTYDNVLIYLCSKTFDSQFSKTFNTSQQDFDSNDSNSHKDEVKENTHCQSHSRKGNKKAESASRQEYNSHGVPLSKERLYEQHRDEGKEGYSLLNDLKQNDSQDNLNNLSSQSLGKTRKYSDRDSNSDSNGEFEEESCQSNTNEEQEEAGEKCVFITEKYLGAKYCVTSIPEDIKQTEFVKYVAEFSKKQLGLPIKNKFIPKNFDILARGDEKKSKYPEKVYESAMSELYFKQDDTFNICKTIFDLFIFTNDCDQSKTAKSYVLQELWIYLFENYVNETKYLASMAHIDLKFEQHYTSFKIRIKGYSDKVGVLFEEFLDLFESFNPKDEGNRIFAIFYEKLMSEYDNYFREAPHSIISDLSKNCLLSTGKFSIKEKIVALKEIKLKDLIEFNQNWLSHTRLESIIMGNITEVEAISWVSKAEMTMQRLRKQFHVLQKEDIPLIRPNKIALNTINLLEFFINEKEFNPEETNSCNI